MDHNFNSIDSIPDFDQVPKEEWELYVNNHGPLAVKQSKDGNIDLMQFWKAKACCTLQNSAVLLNNNHRVVRGGEVIFSLKRNP